MTIEGSRCVHSIVSEYTMNTKNIPAIIMLVAGFMTSVIQIVNSVSLEKFLTTLFAVLLCFYIIGSVVKVILDKSFKDMGEEHPVKTEQEKPEQELENIPIDEEKSSEKPD